MNSDRTFLFRIGIAAMAVTLTFGLLNDITARPITKKGNGSAPLSFFRQRNNLSNIDFFFTNKGVLFNNDAVAGCNWPRGTANSYIFGGGLWFATKKNISGKKKKLCELGYNPNSGAGWYTEGEIGDPENGSNANQKYISYLSPRYSKTTGLYDNVVRSSVPSKYTHWPIWDTSATKTLNRNYYFGDYIADESYRNHLAVLAGASPPQALPNGKIPKPAMLSQEDIVNVYSDQDISANPEYKVNSGYPFNLNIVEVIYTWSFGKYRDMMFIRRKVTNASTTETLFECFVSPAFDPDLGVGGGAAANDINSYFGLTPQDSLDCRNFFPTSSPYHNDPTALNMARQWSKSESSAVPPGEYGCIGFTFLESPITSPNGDIVDISDSAAVGGYCNGLPQLGLYTFAQWTISNDPPTPDLRYDFLSSGIKGHDVTIGGANGADMRLLFSTGPFTLPPGKSVETTVGIGIARPSTTKLRDNQDSVVKLIAFAHRVFADTTGSYQIPTDPGTCASIVKHFITPVPPEVPNLTTTCLDRAVLVQWDYAADNSLDPLSPTLPFNTYDLYRTTRSDHDSTIRPDGVNPIIHLGSWSIWNFRQDSIIRIDTLYSAPTGGKKVIVRNFLGFKFTRKNSVPNIVPHSFLDYGDDNADGVLSGNEGLYNGVKYYYFLLATDEFDSVNSVGPLTTALVTPKNFVPGSPCRPVFPDLPNTIAGDSSCLNGSIGSQNGQLPSSGTSVVVDVRDTGKFLQLYSNDTIKVSFQPRWTEFNPRFLNQSPMNMSVDITDTRQQRELTYDKLYNPNASPVYTPYSFASGIVQEVIGQQPLDSNISGKFSTNDSKFAPYQTIDQAFDVLVNHQYQQDRNPYRLHSIAFDPKYKGVVGISGRTSRAPLNTPVDFADIDIAFTRPSFQGSLGEVTYEISFGTPVDWREDQFDTISGKVFTQDVIKDPSSSVEFKPQALPIKIISKTHCGQELRPIRPGNRNDVVYEADARFYNHTLLATDKITQLPDNSQPDSMIVPLAGKFAMDAYHFIEDNDNDFGSASFMTKTTGKYYFTHGLAGTNSGGKYLATVHRLRLGGAELTFNAPGISNPTTGDTATYSSAFANDFQPGDKITVSFTGLMKGLPFPGAQFVVSTTKDKKLDFSDDGLYRQSKILNEVQVVPNPYIVEHIGQTSTDNAKLYFTRLPPRATIEIYNLAGELVKTLEHIGYQTSTDSKGYVSYDYNTLADRYNVEEWNLLSEGRQRVGSQVFIARVIAKDAKDGTVLGEMTTKFAVVLGGYRLTH